jgi:hypothetical protein
MRPTPRLAGLVLVVALGGVSETAGAQARLTGITRPSAASVFQPAMVPLLPRATADSMSVTIAPEPFRVGLTLARGRSVVDAGAMFRDSLVDLDLRWKLDELALFAGITNAANTRRDEAEVVMSARLSAGSAAEILHFTPGLPRALQLGIERRW